MLLSTSRWFLIIAAFSAFAFTGCGSSQITVNREVGPIPEQKSEFPFSLHEPEVYQAEIFVTVNGVEEHFFIARSGEMWRRDHFDGAARTISELRNADGAYIIDIKKRVYATEPAAGDEVSGFDPESVSNFRGKQYREFEETGRDGGLIRYTARRIETSEDDILIVVDEASGMIVRQEFASPAGDNFVYELRDLRLEADGALFALPAGYRKIGFEQLRTALRKK